ncbi:MAG: restriction endonuclease subunit R, partial [Parcubacteria group bacterium CG23_combo_of_CG06-09_8_20_14_all_35_9]
MWLYHKDKKGEKQNLYNHYLANDFTEKFDYDLKKKGEGKTAKYLLEYDKDYPVSDFKISFSHFINRMSFWMATGSGKTLIIVKLIEFLGKLISEKEIPIRDILFLAHRDDLLDQFKNHIEEFNSFNFETKINLKNLKDYESVKRENVLPFAKNEITVFYYRSDLISDKQKEKIVNFRNYDNDGKWYILLDEAHKGDKEDSKRQVLYSILSRNGFLFNFSATFTDPRDFATCAFSFNLADFVRDGYGKHIYLSSAEIDAFRNKNDFSKLEKQKIVLKTLILLTYIHKYFEKVRKHEKTLYHRPLLLALVNSVNKPDADLQLFFREIENIARERPRLFDLAKEEIISELLKHKKYQFEDDLEFAFDEKEFAKIDYGSVLKYAYNTKKPGSIEISFRPSDKSQVAFKLVTSDRYFALIKTGEMPQWLRDELGRFNVNHRFETEGFFQTINREDSEINVLMGSRSFYEGWDSNRPNMILFVNIGIGSDAKKFVLQSVGRGVRIEPQKHKRRRLKELLNIKEIKEQLFNKTQNLILPIESLFVFGTKVDIVEKIIDSLKPERQEKSLGEAFILNPEAQKRLLLV